ncbi:SHOCT domain-containing protein [Halorubrum rutilum]|uniref:SHOCT domain-containing protein n=1 Tax=Halorubrum rutilum TaxID=1364933 RepID=A0ABD6AK20_9EURY|nr:SHOCT domain-containing protein [Halorubrum rutilum]
MADSGVRGRFERNASEIAVTVVTGTWLAALFLDVGWWLPLLLFGYVVVVPAVAILFDEGEAARWPGDVRGDRTAESDADAGPERASDALDRLRTRYAEGDLTDEQFERKLDRLLETETPEDAAEYARRDRAPDRAADRERDEGPNADRDAERER